MDHGDDSDEDNGADSLNKDSVGLDYDSDDRNDDELIDLGEDRARQGKAAANIPKLNKPQ